MFCLKGVGIIPGWRGNIDQSASRRAGGSHPISDRGGADVAESVTARGEHRDQRGDWERGWGRHRDWRRARGQMRYHVDGCQNIPYLNYYTLFWQSFKNYTLMVIFQSNSLKRLFYRVRLSKRIKVFFINIFFLKFS